MIDILVALHTKRMLQDKYNRKDLKTYRIKGCLQVFYNSDYIYMYDIDKYLITVLPNVNKIAR